MIQTLWCRLEEFGNEDHIKEKLRADLSAELIWGFGSVALRLSSERLPIMLYGS